jgi:predicted RNase H-like nuclease (RuvC/YqgF family)
MKILFAISLLGIAAAAVLAFMTRSKLVEARNEKDAINRQIVGIHEGVLKVDEETNKTWKEWKDTMLAAKDEESAQRKIVRETNELEDTLKQVKKDIEEIVTKRTQMQDEIKAIIGRDGTPEEVLAKVESLKGETDALSQELDTLKKELDVHKKAAGESDKLSAQLKAQQTARLKAIQLGGRSATIVLVNPEFSFVVIRVGRNDGLTSDARILVKRDGVLIAKLDSVLIEANQTIANIDLKSVRPGYQVMPGDQVVFQN